MAYIDFAILPTFHEVLVDSFIGNLGQKSHIGDTHNLLFDAFFPVGFCGSIGLDDLFVAQRFLS